MLSSSLAALAGISSLESTLVANMGSNSLTTMIANGDNLLLYRSVELPQDLNQLAAEVQRNIVVAAAFFEDKLGARPGSLFYAGTEPLSEFAAWVNEPELPVAELAPRTAKGFVTSTAPISTASVSGALAGAR